MSRTDVHVPLVVKMFDPGWRDYFREAHDHRDGVCDLAEFLAAKQWVPTRCQIELAYADRNLCCGCRICTGHHGRKNGRRQQRTALRAALRDAAKTSPADREDLDIAPLRRILAW